MELIEGVKSGVVVAEPFNEVTKEERGKDKRKLGGGGGRAKGGNKGLGVIRELGTDKDVSDADAEISFEVAGGAQGLQGTFVVGDVVSYQCQRSKQTGAVRAVNLGLVKAAGERFARARIFFLFPIYCVSVQVCRSGCRCRYRPRAALARQ